MIVPTAQEILLCIENNIAEKVEPQLSDVNALSAVATIKHMLAFVSERIAHEGQYLTDDVVALRALLPDVVERFRRDGGDRAVEIARSVAEALDREYRAPAAYPDLTSLSSEAVALRQALFDALELLHSPDRPAGVDDLHERARDYLKAQLDAEVRLVEPGFAGYGPRR